LAIAVLRDAPKRAKTWERGGLRGADDIVLVEEPVERQKVPPGLERLTLPARSCLFLSRFVSPGGPQLCIGTTRPPCRSIDKRGRAIFGFIRTSSPEEMGAVAIWPPLDREVLSFSSEAVTYRELLLTGAATGLLSGLVAEAEAGERVLRSFPEGPPRDAVRAEAKKFRRARHLESGEDLRAWLASRGLTLEDFDQYISRVVARARAGSSEPDAERGELTSKLLFGELAFSGAWRLFADTAIRFFAAERLSRKGNPSWPHPGPGQSAPGQSAPGQSAPADDTSVTAEDNSVRSEHKFVTAEYKLGPQPAEVLELLRPFGAFDPSWCDERLGVLRSRARALDDSERQMRGSEALKLRIEDYRVEWALYRYDELQLRSRAAAMEALSCARADRLPADEIARRAGTELTPRRARREELPAGHAAPLDGAAQDEAVGPIEHAGGFSVLWLRERSRPDGTDPEVVERAVAELLSEALERAATGAVREIDQL
jgi:hypothetical protein